MMKKLILILIVLLLALTSTVYSGIISQTDRVAQLKGYYENIKSHAALEEDYENEITFHTSDEEKIIVAENEMQLELASKLRGVLEEEFIDVFGGSAIDIEKGEYLILLTDLSYSDAIKEE